MIYEIKRHSVESDTRTSTDMFMFFWPAKKSAGFVGDGDDNIPSMDHHPGAKKSIEGEWDSPRIAPSN